MKKYLLQVTYFVYRKLGLAWAYRTFVHRRAIAILLFHELTEGQCKELFPVVKRLYRIVSLPDAVAYLEGKEPLESELPLLVITFDDARPSLDGCRDYMRKESIPVTVFASTGVSRRDGVKYASEQMLKDWSSDYQIESHSVSHPNMALLNEDELADEFNDSRLYLGELLGKSIQYFAYPYGRFSALSIAAGKDAGYRAVVTVEPGVNDCGCDLHLLRRICVSNLPSANEVVAKLGGFESIRICLKRLIR